MSPDVEKLMEEGDRFYDLNNFKEAFKCFYQAVQLGDVDAQVNLGHMYANGFGIPADRGKAIFWYKKAVKNNVSAGAYNLANLYKREGNRRWMIFWAKKAAEMGDDWAQDFLDE